MHQPSSALASAASGNCRSQSFVFCSRGQGKIDLSDSVTSTAVSIPRCWVSGSTEVLCRLCQRNVPTNVPGSITHGKGCSLLTPWFLLCLCHKSAVLAHGQLGGHYVPEVLPCTAGSQWVRPFVDLCKGLFLPGSRTWCPLLLDFMTFLFAQFHSLSRTL